MRFFNPISFRSEALNKKTTDNKGKKSGHTTEYAGGPSTRGTSALHWVMSNLCTHLGAYMHTHIHREPSLQPVMGLTKVWLG